MKTTERIVISVIMLLLLGAAVAAYVLVQQHRADIRAQVAAGAFEIRPAEPTASTTPDWRRYYPVTYPMQIKDVTVQASVADTLSARIKGLSDTPYLPDDVVKLFAFGAPGAHSIWMKDMQYPLDIIWTDQAGVIVHIEPDVSPDTYNPAHPRQSRTFGSPVDAWFVVEANAGFVAQHGIVVGDTVTIPGG